MVWSDYSREEIKCYEGNAVLGDFLRPSFSV